MQFAHSSAKNIHEIQFSISINSSELITISKLNFTALLARILGKAIDQYLLKVVQ